MKAIGKLALSFLLLMAFLLPAPLSPAWAADVTFQGDFVQGGLIVARTAPGSKVQVDGHPVHVAPDGLFLMGFGRDAGKSVSLKITGPSGETLARDLAVASRQFKIQRIDGLPPKKVSPDPELVKRIRAENALIHEARKLDTEENGFREAFIWPVHGPISSVFGSQRILNGEPRAPHSGVDIAAPAGTPIVACADGVVSLVHPDMFLTGKSVLIDHGHGLASVYIHMSEIDVKEGQRVLQGDLIGRVGASGRATGPHLHWGVSLFQTRLDPELLVPPMPSSD